MEGREGGFEPDVNGRGLPGVYPPDSAPAPTGDAGAPPAAAAAAAGCGDARPLPLAAVPVRALGDSAVGATITAASGGAAPGGLATLVMVGGYACGHADGSVDGRTREAGCSGT